MKLIDYNIREGLLANYGQYREDHTSTAVIDPERYRLLVDFLKAQAADVVQLQELTGWDQTGFDRFQQDTGYPYGSLSRAGTIHHMGVLSKLPIDSSEDENQYHPHATAGASWWQQRAIWHALPRTEIAGITFFNVHLCPQLPEDRQREFVLLRRLAPNEHVIISGDFNGLCATEYSHKLYYQLSNEQHRKFGPAGTGNVVDALVDLGFVDVFANEPAEFTAPTKSNRDLAHGEAPLRLDFCLVSSDLASSIGSHSVIRTPQTDQISDHYPLVITIF